MKLTVIIVNYNVKFYVEQCLYSLRKALTGIDAEICVVDNCSNDGSIDYLKPRFDDVVFIQNQENLGFSRANNIAIRNTKQVRAPAESGHNGRRRHHSPNYRVYGQS